MNTGASLGAGVLTGGGSLAATARMCEDANFFADNAQACSEHFGAFAGWAATNPETAALFLGVLAFGGAQLGQWAVGKFMERT